MTRWAFLHRILAPWLALLSCGLLVACAAPPRAAPVLSLLRDADYPTTPAVEPPESIFALDDAMRRYADTELRAQIRRGDPRRALIRALYERGQLRLAYDAGSTRNAAEAFEARAGNCLSLVIMSAAFAKHLGLPVSYRQVDVEEQYSRSGGLLLAAGHVNLILDRLFGRPILDTSLMQDLTVDFLPGQDLHGERSKALPESTVVAMYYNNRAAEALAANRHAESYRWARAAVLQRPDYAPAINTLAVIYLRDQRLAAAEAALRAALDLDPANAGALSNLAQTLRREGRGDEAATIERRLAAVQPVQPFAAFEAGRLAMASGDYTRARDLFERELRLQPDQSEVHFWLAQALWRLGDRKSAAHHLALAADNSTTPGSHDLYAAKLEHLKALHVQ